MNRETQAKAFGGALSGVILALMALVNAWAQNGSVTPMALEGFGTALGVFAEVAVGAVVGYVTVYFAPRNKPVDE